MQVLRETEDGFAFRRPLDLQSACNFRQTFMDPQTTTPIAATTEKLVEDLRILAHDAEALLSATAGQTDVKIGELRQRLSAAVRGARGTCEELQGKAAEQIRRGAHETDLTVRAHPWEAVGVAFGIGVVVGILLSRR